MKKLTPHDRFLIRGYLSRVLRRSVSDNRLYSCLRGWIAEYGDPKELDRLDVPFLSEEFQELRGERNGGGGHGITRRGVKYSSRRFRPGFQLVSPSSQARECLSRAIGKLERLGDSPPAEGAEARAAGLVARRFDLPEPCGDLINLYCLHREIPIVRLWNQTDLGCGDHLEASALFLGVSRNQVEGALRHLSGVGIADRSHWGGRNATPDDYIESWFHECLYDPPVADERELQGRLLPLAPEPLLPLDAFDYLDARTDAVQLLAASLASRQGVRLLLYGRAGTGKTEFAKALVRACGGRLYTFGESDPFDSVRGEDVAKSLGVSCRFLSRSIPDRGATKRNRLRMASALLRSEPGAALLCDEVEDVLSSERGTRQENHRLLEAAAVPIVFTANDLADFDEALLRRFDLTIHFKTHSPTRRRAVVCRMLESSGIESLEGKAREPLASRLADELECPPGIIERAIRSTWLVKGSPEDLFRFAERHERTVSSHHARPRLGPPVRPNLPWEAFGHLGEGAEDVRQLFMAALCGRRDAGGAGRGVSFLAYGPPGCGKTEFCRTLAAEAGATLYSIGDREHGPDARLPVPRRLSLEYAIEALTDEPDAVILFDEIEDFVFGENGPWFAGRWKKIRGAARRTRAAISENKHWLNDLVENTPVPLLFTANAINRLRRRVPHFLDRLTYSLEFRHLPRERRTTMFGDLLDAKGAPEMTSLAETLATDRRVTPRQVRNASQIAALSGSAAARRIVREKAQLLRGPGHAEAKAPEKYDLSLVHATPDLAALTDRIAAIGHCRLGILLDGPSGSGKSEYAKQLAQRMDLDPLPKRASELMSAYVGETEQQIAGAFAEARATRSFLIIDEADSFLADRRDARRNWEISSVNEMLSQLEDHDLPYAFTTNLADRLDPAAARRFLFRATFKFLDEARVVRAWEFFFGGGCPARVRALTRLVPADFALVRERAEMPGFPNEAEQMVRELIAQVRSKSSAAAVGF